MPRTPRRRRAGSAVLAALVAVTAVAAALVWRLGVIRPDRDNDRAADPSPTAEPGVALTGPLNLLLVGVDTRLDQPTWSPKADAVLIVHVPDSHDHAYLFSLPRDLLVDALGGVEVSLDQPGDSVVTDGTYQGERLAPVSEEFIAAVREGRVAPFLAEHGTLRD